MKAKDIKVGMRYVEDDPFKEEGDDASIDAKVTDVEHLVSNKTGATRGVIATLEDGSIIHWMDPNKEVPGVS